MHHRPQSGQRTSPKSLALIARSEDKRGTAGESFQALHRNGWSVGIGAAHKRDGWIVCIVDAHKGDRRVEGRGASTTEGWRAALGAVVNGE
jgi:hypothetical protein